MIKTQGLNYGQKMMKLSGNLTAKWTIVNDEYKIVGSTARVSLDGANDSSDDPFCDGIDDVVSDLVDANGANEIHVFSGVHGSPQGMLQIDAPEFFLTDKEALEQNIDGLVIKVFLIPFPDEGVISQLKISIDNKNIFVVLGWCFSSAYLNFHHYVPGQHNEAGQNNAEAQKLVMRLVGG